jgi:hypothetical protein
MSFVKRLKSDKKFRLNVMIVFALAVLIFGNTPEAKKEAVSQSTCNQANEGALSCEQFEAPVLTSITGNHCMNIRTGGGPVLESAILCESLGCVVGREIDSSGILTEQFDEYACISNAPAGIAVKSSSACISKEGTENSALSAPYNLICASGGPGPTCSGITKTLSGFVDDLPFFKSQNCKTNFYFVAFGGGLLALVLVLAAI